jgi:hypothetical protein
MSAMDRKQRKAKKREDKAKNKKIQHSSPKLKQDSEMRKKYGAIQLAVFLVIAIAGATFILMNV